MKKLKSFFSGMYLTLIFIFLYAPIVTLIIFSFNKGKGSRWKGFSLKWYEDLFESRMIMEALSNTLIIAFVSALVATLVGTITCIGINALKGKFKTTYMAINNIPLMNSDLDRTFIDACIYFCWLEVWLFHYIGGAYHVQYSVCDLKRYASSSPDKCKYLRGSYGFRCNATVCFF